MRFPQLTAAVLIAASVMLALAGCVQQPPKVIPTTQPTAAPVFATDADALAAAKNTFTGYLAASDAIAHDGGKDVGRLMKWDTRKQFSRDTKSFQSLQTSGKHSSGLSRFDSFTLQKQSSTKSGAQVVAYACLDVSKTRLLNSKNEDVTPNRPTVVPLELSFVSGSESPDLLLLDGSVVWQGKTFCA